MLARWALCRPAVAASFRRFNASLAAHPNIPTGTPTSAAHAEEARVPFSDLKGVVNDRTLKALIDRPFQLTNMTVVQAAVLPLLPKLALPAESGSSDTRDLLVKAKTGTGKTLAFLIPAMEARLNQLKAVRDRAADESGDASQATDYRAQRIFARKNVGTLIISPTRELASQIAVEATRLATYHDEFEVRLFVGGVSKGLQMRDWNRGRRDIVVATPGRLRDLLENEPGFADCFKQVQVLVLDEADTLLDMGFRDDLEAVNAYLPPKSERQTFLFSATVSPAIHQIATKTMDKHHMFINTVSDDSSPVHAHIPQFHTILNNASEQIPHLLRLIAQDQLANYGKSKIIVFFPTTKMTQLFTTLLRTLKRDALPAGRSTEIYEIHSKKSQESRTNTSDNFRRDVSGASVLVTSDVSARGVDYPNVTRVIQIGIPGSPEQYVHRVGRTGRRDLAGRGDLVLLPWEAGFVTYRLADIPIKPLRTEELTQQVQELAAKVDSEGLPQLDRPRQARPDRFDPRSRDRRYSQQMTINLPVAPTLANVETRVQGLLQDLDSEAINDTFTSILGYYFGKSGELRCDKEVILEGCKQYTVDGLGLTEAPYVSRAFLDKIGFSEPRRRQPSRDGSRNRVGMRNDRPRFGLRQASRDTGDHDTPSESSGFRSGSGFDRSRPRFGASNGFERQSSGFERNSRPRTPSGDRDGWSSRGQGSGQGSGRFNRSSRYDDSSRRPAFGNN